MSEKDLYRILGVSRTADDTEIKKRYRTLARELHPDRNPDPAAEARFKEVSAAFAVLGDEKKRSIYDEFGPDGLRDGFDAESARNYQRFAGRFGGFGGPGGFNMGPGGGLGGFGDLDDLLGGLFGGGFGGFGAPPKRRGQDVVRSLAISLRQAVAGTEIQLSDAGVNVKVPAGIASGQKIRVPGKGQQGSGGAGDLYLTFNIATPPGCTVDEDDLTLDLPVSVLQAIQGTSVELPLPDGGAVKLNIPAGTQSGRRLRLRNRGMTKGGRGHLYVRVMVQVPTGDDPELLALAESFERFYSVDKGE